MGEKSRLPQREMRKTGNIKFYLLIGKNRVVTIQGFHDVLYSNFIFFEVGLEINHG